MSSEFNARSGTVRFGAFEADLTTRELRKSGVRIKLHGQPFEILAMLLERPGELVARQDLQQRLWPTDTFVDFDHGVNSAINRLREALSDSAETPRFIETVSRRGYRFVAPVEWPASSATKSENESPEPVSAAPPVFAPHTRWLWGWIGAAIVLAVAIFGLATKYLGGHLFAGRNSQSIQSLAVLPLVNLSGDPEQEYFADGMTDTLTTNLGKIGALRVISRTSAMGYKGTKKPLRDVAKELNVDAVVEGTVTRSANHLRITANLVQAVPEKHLWAETYEGDVGDALAVQEKIAQAIAREIQVKLTRQEQSLLAQAHPVNPEAQDLYLRGLYILNEGDTATLSARAIEYFDRAAAKDPNYASAYAGLALAYSNWIPGMGSQKERMQKAKNYALKALSLDSTSADAHSTLGCIKLFHDWDWDGSEEEFNRTMALNPNHVWAREWHARGLVTAGRTDEAVDQAKLSASLDPSPWTGDYPVWILFLARRYDLALEHGRDLVELAPNYTWGHFALALIYEQMGKADDGARESLKADELFGIDPKIIARLKNALAKDGARGYWEQKLDYYLESAKAGYAPPVLTAEACVRVGDKQCTFEWLEKGFQERDDLMINLAVNPVFDGVKTDPRYQDLVRRVGIPSR